MRGHRVARPRLRHRVGPMARRLSWHSTLDLARGKFNGVLSLAVAAISGWDASPGQERRAVPVLLREGDSTSARRWRKRYELAISGLRRR